MILGNKTATKGGSGKVVDSGPNDHIFIFYSDHGGPGVLGELSVKPIKLDSCGLNEADASFFFCICRDADFSLPIRK